MSSDEDKLSISAGGTELFSLETDGNLTISGSLTAGNPGMTFPDYVFAPDYELMPLETVGQFISDNKHLPGIPTAVEVAAQGVNMTELQLKLLRKVEELTLYTVQQQKRIAALEEEIAAIRDGLHAPNATR